MIAQSESLHQKFDDICRLCLKEESPMSSIFATTRSPTGGPDGEQRSTMLAARITSIAKVQISPNDGLPEFVCQECRREVEKFHEFRSLVEISDRTLRSCFERAREASNDGGIARRPGVESTEYREYAAEHETTESDGDVFPVNAILVPSAHGMQVWQICSADEEPLENGSIYGTRIDESLVCAEIENGQEFQNSSLAEESERRAGGASRGTIKTEKDESAYFCATSPERISNCKSEVVDEEENVSPNEYDCQLCFKSFQSLESLKNHVSDHFLGDGRIAKRAHEGIVGLTSAGENSTVEKSREPTGDDDPHESLACQSCDELIDTAEQRILHARRKTTVEGPECRYCGKAFLKLSSRNYHEQNIHEGKSREKRAKNATHKCDDCGQEFVKRSAFRYHKGTHTSLSSTCTICNKHLRNAQSLKMHVKRHTLGSRYNCIECGKSFYTNSELARHVQQHTGTREYPCHLCDMSFLSKPELNRHFKYHNGEKKFECKLCRKTYYESGHLKVHERVHTGERPFSCTVCQKGFITRSKLVRHLKIHDRARGTRRAEAKANPSGSHQ